MAQANKVKKPAKTDAQRAADFVKLANVRAGKAVRGISDLAKLARPSVYKYDSAQTSKLFAALENAIAAAKRAFESPATGGAKTASIL